VATGTLQYESRAGWYVEWYRDDDGDSGFGDNAEVCRWYGTHEECSRVLLYGPPRYGWIPCGELGDGGPPFDAATATGMYDR
jgi:hypothetical protein